MKYIAIISFLFLSVMAFADEPSQFVPLQDSKGRYIFGQEGENSQYLLDTATGELWQIVVDKNNNSALKPVPKIQPAKEKAITAAPLVSPPLPPEQTIAEPKKAAKPKKPETTRRYIRTLSEETAKEKPQEAAAVEEKKVVTPTASSKKEKLDKQDYLPRPVEQDKDWVDYLRDISGLSGIE